MKKGKPIDRIVDSTGCLTQEALRLYLTGTAGRKEKELMDQHLKGCSFCREALDGYAAMGDPEKFGRNVESLKQGIRKHIQKEEPKAVSLIYRRRYVVLAAAASLLLLAGLFSVFRYYPAMRKNLSGNHLAENVKTSADSGLKDSATVTIRPQVSEKKEGLPQPKKSAPRKMARTGEESNPAPAIKVPATDAPVEITSAERKVSLDTTGEKSAGKADDHQAVAGIAVTPSADSRSLSETVVARKMTISGNSRQLTIQTGEKREKGNQEIYVVVEEMPTFRGKGMDEFEKYIRETMRYPAEARKQGIEGTVQVSFIVDTDGRLSDVTVIRSANPLLDTEALRVVKSSPEWKPGLQNGKAVKVQLSVSVRFRAE